MSNAKFNTIRSSKMIKRLVSRISAGQVAFALMLASLARLGFEQFFRLSRDVFASFAASQSLIFSVPNFGG